MRRRWSVVTSNIGKYDRVPRLPAALANAADCVLITDDRRTARTASRRGWRPEVIQDNTSPHVASRRPKARPDQFTAADCSIWVDCRFRFVASGLVDWADEQLADDSLALYPHPWRSTWTEEAQYCISHDIAAKPLERQVAHYKRERTPRDLRLWAGGIIVRAHEESTAYFGDIWLGEIRRWDSRDQVSLPVALWRAGLTPAAIDGSVYENPHVKPRHHRYQSPVLDRLARQAHRSKEPPQ